MKPFLVLSDPDRIQTYNLLIRSQILYSVELRGHPKYIGRQIYGKMVNGKSNIALPILPIRHILIQQRLKLFIIL